MARRRRFVFALALWLARPLVAQQVPFALSGDVVGVHDPSILRVEGHAGSQWYVFSTTRDAASGQLPIRCSADAHVWRSCGHVFEAMPAWITARSPETKGLWAPDVSYVDGVYRVYYAFSKFGKNESGIGLAVNLTLDPASPDYKWMDRGLVLESKHGDDFNAIDPGFLRDAEGRDWLVFGSFWSGIKMRQLGARTGLPMDTKTYSLARRADGGHAVEAPVLVRHGEYYYLFTSWDSCCRGAKSTYRITVGRAKDVTGPYVDDKGVRLDLGGGTEVIAGNAEWAGPGGQSVWIDPAGKQDLLVFHAYEVPGGRPDLQVSPIVWRDSWPHVEFASVADRSALR